MFKKAIILIIIHDIYSILLLKMQKFFFILIIEIKYQNHNEDLHKMILFKKSKKLFIQNDKKTFVFKSIKNINKKRNLHKSLFLLI